MRKLVQLFAENRLKKHFQIWLYRKMEHKIKELRKNEYCPKTTIECSYVEGNGKGKSSM